MRARPTACPGPSTTASLTALAVVWLVGTVSAQSTDIRGRIGTAAGIGPAHSALVRFTPRPWPIEGLAWLPAVWPSVADGSPVETTTIECALDDGGRGRFRIAGDAARTGSVLVVAGESAGLVATASPSQPALIELAPAGVLEFSLSGREERVHSVVWVRAMRPTIRVRIDATAPPDPGVPLGRFECADGTLSLPPGTYRLLCRVDDREWFERRVRVQPGERMRVAAPASARPTAAHDRARIDGGRRSWFVDWPEVGVWTEDDEPRADGPLDRARARTSAGDEGEQPWHLLQRGRASSTTSVDGWPTRVAVLRRTTSGFVLCVAADPRLAAGHPPRAMSLDHLRVPPAGVDAPTTATVFVPDSASTSGTPAWAVLVPDDTTLAVVASELPTDRPPAGADDRAPSLLVEKPAHTLTVAVLDADGAPVVDARVTLEPALGGTALRRMLWTDARGFATFDRLPGPSASLLVEADGLVSQRLEVEASPGSTPIGPPTTVELASGRTLVGRVVQIDSEGRRRPIAGATVELRDTTAELGERARTLVTGEDGRFRFAGLPDALYTVFASRQVGVTTWSARRRGLQPGRDEHVLVLANEDPAPPGDRR